MKVCLPFFLFLCTWLSLAARELPEPAPFLGLKWGMDQDEVEEALATDDNLLPHTGYFVLYTGSERYYCRSYGTYMFDSVPMELVCGFDEAYTALRMVSLRYHTQNFDRALTVYEKAADTLSQMLIGADSDRKLRHRERSPTRQDRLVDWRFPETRFHMRVWGSDANGHVTIWFSQLEEK